MLVPGLLASTLVCLTGLAAADEGNNTAAGGEAAAPGTTLYVSSYVGKIFSLDLNSTNLALTSMVDCANNASWLTWDAQDRVLYCLDEGLTVPNGTLQSYTASEDGELTPVTKETTISGPVSGVLYGRSTDKHGLALAHYTGSAVSAWSGDTKGSLSKVQDDVFTLAQLGPNPSRQEAPHEHEAITDPTGKFIVVPDLGADLVRVFSFDSTTYELTTHAPLQAKAGSGPRHAAFWVKDDKTYFYLVAELGVTVTAYEVTYLSGGDGLSFKEIAVYSTFGNGETPAGAAPAEIQVSPDQRFVVVSNRNDSSFLLPNFHLNNQTAEPSDSLASFALNDDGTLTFQRLSPAGGSFPRQFSMNKDGSLVAVGLQSSSRVVILERDIESGVIGGPRAATALPGQITCVVWDDQ